MGPSFLPSFLSSFLAFLLSFFLWVTILTLYPTFCESCSCPVAHGWIISQFCPFSQVASRSWSSSTSSWSLMVVVGRFWLLEFLLLKFWLLTIHIKYCLHCTLDRSGEVFLNSAVAVLDEWQTQFICHILHEINLVRPFLILCSMAVNNPCIIYYYVQEGIE